MRIRKTYIGKIQGVTNICRDIFPDNLVIEEEIITLYPDKGFMLKCDNSEGSLSYAILSDIKEKDNYTEVEVLEELNDLGK